MAETWKERVAKGLKVATVQVQPVRELTEGTPLAKPKQEQEAPHG